MPNTYPNYPLCRCWVVTGKKQKHNNAGVENQRQWAVTRNLNSCIKMELLLPKHIHPVMAIMYRQFTTIRQGFEQSQSCQPLSWAHPIVPLSLDRSTTIKLFRLNTVSSSRDARVTKTERKNSATWQSDPCKQNFCWRTTSTEPIFLEHQSTACY